MSCTAQKRTNAITLKGSAEILCQYLDFGINSILFQRGIYPPKDFIPVDRYGLTVFMSKDEEIKEFISVTLSQLKQWLVERLVHKVVLVLTDVETLEVMELWEFYVEYEGDSKSHARTSHKPLELIKNEIRSVLKQIVASVTYLPLLTCLCKFDIQIYTKDDVNVPEQWADAEPANVKNGQCVKMGSFTTSIHKMETAVLYKNLD